MAEVQDFDHLKFNDRYTEVHYTYSFTFVHTQKCPAIKNLISRMGGWKIKYVFSPDKFFIYPEKLCNSFFTNT